MRVKNWNQMQNAAVLRGGGGGGVFHRCEEYAQLLQKIWLFLSYVRNIGIESVKNWYLFFTRCEELVSPLRGVKFTECEIKHISIRSQRTL